LTLSGHLELHKRTLPDGPERKRLEMMGDIIDSLNEQLDFTEAYRRIGVNSPEWQSVQKAGEEAAVYFDREEVTISIDSGNVELLADPMQKKVFYNLIRQFIETRGEDNGDPHFLGNQREGRQDCLSG
jgi:hypothetical protein